MRSLKTTGLQMVVFATTMAATLLPMTATAQQVPGPHPAYLHALSDLRAARHYLHDNFAWGPVMHDDNMAIHEIDIAIGEIKQAAIDDGKGDNDPFPIDSSLSPHDRFKKADELLYAAHQDLAHAEDVPQARDLRNGSLKHVDRAHDIVKKAESTAKWQ